MPPGSNRGADALVASLQRAGVEQVFTLSGNHIMPVFDAALDAGIRLIHVRHEASTVHMADAWARLTGRPGVALVTGGPGHANAVSALYTARMAESPVVLLSGHAPNGELGMGAFQEMRQAEIAAPLTKASWTVARADDVSGAIDKALRWALGGRPGPVHVSLPIDCLEDEAPRDTATHPSVEAKPVDLCLVAELLSQAKRPLILAGPASMTRSGRARTAALEAALGIPVIGMESPRGIADPSLGAFAQILAQSDRILLLGKKLDFTLKFGKAPAFAPACEFLQVDPEAEEIERTGRAVGPRLRASAIADTGTAIAALMKIAKPMTGSWRDEVLSALAYRPAAWDTAKSSQADRVHPAHALRPLQKILEGHPDAVFVSDGGEIGQWAQACLTAPHRVINGVAGSIGGALPFALAARLAHPEAPVVAVMGDGTFGFHAAEMDTAVRYKLPFLCVVGNDARWNAEYQIQLRDYGARRLIGCELLPTRYDQVTLAFGGHGEMVTDAGEVFPAAMRAIRSKLPACLNVMIEGLPAPNIKR